MRARVKLCLLALALLAGCAETVRCPDGHFFGDDGTCEPIPDAGPANDAASPPDDGG